MFMMDMGHDVDNVNLSNLIPFQLHPVATKDGEQLQELMDSIEHEGLNTPIVVRRVDAGKYEIICGHNRVEAMRALGLDVIQAVVMENMSDDAARELFYSTYLTPRAFWSWDYLQRFHAIQYLVKVMQHNSHQGRRNDLIEKINDVTRDDQELHTRRPTSRDNAAASIGISTATFSRYRSMVQLPDDAMELMAHLLDAKLLTINEAYKLSMVEFGQARKLLQLLEDNPDMRVDLEQLKELHINRSRVKTVLPRIHSTATLKSILIPR